MQNKTPYKLLYIADFLMLACVLFMALPNIILKQPLNSAQTAVLAAIVALASLMMILPYLLQNKFNMELAKKGANIDEAKLKEQLAAVFADLRTLRAKISEQSEISKAAELTIETLVKDYDAILKGAQKSENIFGELKGAIKELHGVITENIIEAEQNKTADNADTFDNEKFLELSKNLTQLEISIHTIKNEFEEFKASFDFSDEEEADESIGEFSEASYSDDTDDLEEDDSDEDSEDYEEDEDEIDEENFEEAEEKSYETEEFENEKEPQKNSYGKVEADNKPMQAKKWEGLIDKALFNSQTGSTKEVVSRFIGKKSEEEPQPNLFDESEIPEQAQKAKRAKTGETAVILNAFLGIGNAPYIRGEIAGLSQNKGAQMQMLEIGKWQWKCDALVAEEIKFTIWINDETPSELGELSLNPNETIEVDL